MKQPRALTSDEDRQMARRMRDHQWEVMERVAALGTLWICWWNKDRHHTDYSRPDLLICGLIDGMELLEWMGSHKDWWIIGEWSDERYAAPVSLTDAGKMALANRERPSAARSIVTEIHSQPTADSPKHLVA